MDRFHGFIGYGIQKETTPGVWTDEIIEREVYGEFKKNYARTTNNGNVNNDIALSNIISVVTNAYFRNNYQSIRYIKFNGQYWSITFIELNYPRADLTLGGVYNGIKCKQTCSSQHID